MTGTAQKTTGRGLLVYRMAGAAFFDAGTYEGIEADRSAWPQALAAVLLSSLCAGIGVSGWEGPAVTTVALAAALAVVGWFTWAMLMFQIGTRILPLQGTRTTFGEMLRTIGFAASPGVLQAFAALPRLRTPVLVIAWVWIFAATVFAVRHALDYRHGARAFGVCALAAALVIGLALVLGLLFGPSVS